VRARYHILIASVAGLSLLSPVVTRQADAAYQLLAIPSTTTVLDGTTSSLVDLYLHSDDPTDEANLETYGAWISYMSMTVIAGNAPIDAVNANAINFDAGTTTTNTGTFAEISEFSSAPFTSGSNGVLLGSFDVDMPLGGTETDVSLDANNDNAPILVYTDATGDFNPIVADSGEAVFLPSVPEPTSSIWGLSLLAITGLARKSRRLCFA
jgi:hypothetical protein